MGPDPFIPQSSPDHSPQPRIDFSYHEISGPDICSLICAQSSLLSHLSCYIDFNQLWNILIWNKSISHFRVYFHSIITKGQFMWTRIRKISNVTYVITQVMPNDILLIIKQKLMGNTNICVSSVDENSNILGIWKGKNCSWHCFTNSRFQKFTKWPIF